MKKIKIVHIQKMKKHGYFLLTIKLNLKLKKVEIMLLFTAKLPLVYYQHLEMDGI